jgi:hypothetical protein
MENPQMDEAERIRQHMIHHEQDEEQRGDQAPEKTWTLIFQVHVIQNSDSGLDERDDEQEQQELLCRKVFVCQKDFNADDAKQTDPDSHVGFHLEILLRCHSGHLIFSFLQLSLLGVH